MRVTTIVAVAATLLCASVASAQPTGTMADPRAGENAALKNPDANGPDSNGLPSKGANSFTEKQAADRIAKAGYVSVTGLKQDKDGLWRGSAMKDGRPVEVSLDYKGNVNAQ